MILGILCIIVGVIIFIAMIRVGWSLLKFLLSVGLVIACVWLWLALGAVAVVSCVSCFG